jgi:hypothetical protein
MKAIAAERRRFGYGRIHIMLERQGVVKNLKTLRRLYSEERLQVRKCGGRKWAPGTRRPMAVPQSANDRWSLDFISDALTDGRRFRVLAVVDDFTRECLALIADTIAGGHQGRGNWPRCLTPDGAAQAQSEVTMAPRVHLDGDPVMVSADRHRLALHCAGKAHAEWVHLELQRPLPGRVPERGAVLDPA